MGHLIQIAVLTIMALSAFYQYSPGKNPADHSYYLENDGSEDYYQDGLFQNLDGFWEDADGNLLSIDSEEGLYRYCTWYGRTGEGEFYGDDDSAWLWYDDFIYNLLSDGEGFALEQEVSSGTEEINGAYFKRSENEFQVTPVETLDGIWQNALGETLVIDTERQEYLSYTEKAADWGYLQDYTNGCGIYLSMCGFAYPCFGDDGNSFVLYFEENKGEENPDGRFSGIFYRDGDAGSYADLKKAGFYQAEGRLWYFDGIQFFAVPVCYTLGEDGLAYDKQGNVFGAGQEWKEYDPSADWGEDWADMDV